MKSTCIRESPSAPLDDLKGLKLRTSGAWAEIANNLGASTVILPGGEVYPALERGVVDAIEWATPGINIGLGFHKVAKYIILPGVHQPGAVLECVFDKALWEGFDASTRTQIEAAAKMSTIESWMNINVMDVDALEKLKAEGVEFIRVDQGYIDGVAKATKAWEDKYIAEEGGWFKKVVGASARVRRAVEAIESVSLRIQIAHRIRPLSPHGGLDCQGRARSPLSGATGKHGGTATTCAE